MRFKLIIQFTLTVFIYQVGRLINRVIWKFNYPSDAKMMKNLLSHNSKYPKMESIDNTINEIVTHRKSITRFGDGEYKLVLGRAIGFQKLNFILSFRMYEILKSNNNGDCLVGIIVQNLNGINTYSKQFWYENNNYILSLFSDKKYYNARITREITKESIIALKQAWLNRDVVFVSGKNSRFDINHVIFEDVKEKRSIWTLPIDAWSEYDKILNEVVDVSKNLKDPIVICAIGPTATVLAYDLSVKGIQCLDLGHITNCYDRLFENAMKPEELGFLS